MQMNTPVIDKKRFRRRKDFSRALLVLVFSLGASDAMADQAMGFAVGYDYWNYKVSGRLVDGDTDLRLHRDLGLKTVNHDSFFLRWDTGPGWWRPDLSASYMRISLSGDQSISGNAVQIGPIGLLPVTTAVLTHAGINDSELTFSYPLPMGFLSPLHGSAGLTLKYLNGDLNIQQAGGADNVQKVNELFPMLHLDMNLPVGPYLNLVAGGNWVQYGGEGAYEYSGGAEFRILGPITLSARWLQKHYNVDDGYRLRANLRGALLGVHVVFE